MPKSKRAVVVHLSEVEKKGRDAKVRVVEAIRECLDEYENLFLVEYENMRTALFQKVRRKWPDSKFFMCKNSLIRVALGATPETEQRPGVHKLTKDLAGNLGLMMTNKSEDEVLKFFAEYQRPTYARSGSVATRGVELKAGIIPGQPFSNFEFLKGLGLPVSLKRGKIELLAKYVICKHGQVLNPEQCKLLKLFEHQLAVFRLHVSTFWSEESGFKSYAGEAMDEEK